MIGTIQLVVSNVCTKFQSPSSMHYIGLSDEKKKKEKKEKKKKAKQIQALWVS